MSSLQHIGLSRLSFSIVGKLCSTRIGSPCNWPKRWWIIRKLPNWHTVLSIEDGWAVVQVQATTMAMRKFLKHNNHVTFHSIIHPRGRSVHWKTIILTGMQNMWPAGTVWLQAVLRCITGTSMHPIIAGVGIMKKWVRSNTRDTERLMGVVVIKRKLFL